MRDIITLPRPTISTLKGPIISASNATLRLDYDFENNDGAVEWTGLSFGEVLAYRFHQSVCADTQCKVENNAVTVLGSSVWLSERLHRWDQAVGGHKFQIDQGGSNRFRHYMVEFDDVRLVEIISSKIDICIL